MNNITKSIALISFSVLALNASTATSPEAAQIICDAGITRINTQLEMEAEFEAITQQFQTEKTIYNADIARTETLLEMEAEFQSITTQFEAEKILAQKKEIVKSHPVYIAAKCGVALSGAAIGAYFAPAVLTYAAIKIVPVVYGSLFSAPSSYIGYSLWWAGQYNAIGAVISQGFYPAILAGTSIGATLTSTGFDLLTNTALYTTHTLPAFDQENGISQCTSDALYDNVSCISDELYDSGLYSPVTKRTCILSDTTPGTAIWANYLWNRSSV